MGRGLHGAHGRRPRRRLPRARRRRARVHRLREVADQLTDVRVRRLDAAGAREHLDGLARVLHDCVDGGASVSFMWPFSLADARAAFEAIVPDLQRGKRVLLGAFVDGELVGTAQIAHAWPPNQPHRADVAKVLVHRSARRRGLAKLLMEHVEREAVADGKTLLVLDTVTGDAAEALYERLGWTKVGVIPRYALYPDGRECATTVFFKDLRARAGYASSSSNAPRSPRT